FFSLGFAAHYVEAENPDVLNAGEDQSLKGIALGVGLVALLNKQIRVAASLENFNNRRVAAVAPKAARVGIAWDDPGSNLTAHLELRQRDRSKTLELPIPGLDGLTLASEEISDKPEKMALGSLQVKTFDMLKFFAGYGRTLESGEREIAGGGLGIFQKSFSFSYAASKNFPNATDWQSSLHLSLTMKI
ncbi:MAG: hypothetical protein NTX25_09890, partial [Proteobacteria bacterium]|nr:hypothetical protein [Pseudomonadota bacterium]